MCIGCINILIIDTSLCYLANNRRAMKDLFSLLNRYVVFAGKFINKLLFPYDIVNNHIASHLNHKLQPIIRYPDFKV